MSRESGRRSFQHPITGSGAVRCRGNASYKTIRPTVAEPLRRFSQKEIRKAILKKARPDGIRKGGPHWTGWVRVDERLVTFVKVPNEHRDPLSPGAANQLAKELRLSHSEYNRFVDCKLKRDGYLEIQRAHERGDRTEME